MAGVRGVNEAFDKCGRGRRGGGVGGGGVRCVSVQKWSRGKKKKRETKDLVGTSVRLVRDQIYDH